MNSRDKAVLAIAATFFLLVGLAFADGTYPPQGSGGASSGDLDALFGSTQGNILYRNATVWTVLAPGTAGDHLRSGGAGGDVSWEAPPAGTLAATLAAGNTTGGTDITVSTGDNIVGAAELDLLAGAGTNAIQIRPGAGAGAGTGGALNAFGGAGGATGDGGSILITGGAGGASGGDGGGVQINAGNSPTATDGTVSIGVANTSGITVGASGITTTFTGSTNLTISDGALTCPSVAGPAGTLTLGSASSHPTLPDDARLQFGSTAGGGDVRMSGELTTLTDASATTVLSVVTGDGDVTGIQITYFLESSNGTDSLAETGTVQIAIIDDAGGVVASAVGEVSAQINSTAGDSLTTAWTVVTTDDQSIEVQCNADAIGLTPTTHQVRWVATYPSNVTITVP